jgi:hypothetical protein
LRRKRADDRMARQAIEIRLRSHAVDRPILVGQPLARPISEGSGRQVGMTRAADDRVCGALAISGEYLGRCEQQIAARPVLTKRASAIAPTPKGKGLTGTITITVRDSGMTEVNGTPVRTAHPDTGLAEAIAALLVELYKQVDQRKRQRPVGQ